MADGSTRPPSAEPASVPRAAPADVARLYGIGRLARHILFCAGPDCCEPALGDRVWDRIKRRLAALRLAGNGGPESPAVYRTRCQCLRMCNDGPIMLVYPEGAWYQNVTEEAAERIIDEHVVGGRVVEELCFALNPLAGRDLRPASGPRNDPGAGA